MWRAALVLLASARAAEAQAIRPGTTVEVTVAGDAIRGAVVRSSASRLVVRTARGMDSIPLASIDSWRWRDTHALPAARTGGITGAVALGLLGASAGAGLCEGDCDNASLQGGILGAAVGTLAGAAAGALLGSLLPEWRDAAPGAKVIVAESPLSALPVRIHGGLGRLQGQGSMSEIGATLVRGGMRIGVEAGRVGHGSVSTLVFHSATDARLRSYSERSRSTKYLGLAAERRIAGVFWVTGSVTHRRLRETTWTDSVRIGESQEIMPLTRTTVTSDESAPGGSFGLLMRHRVIDDLWLRVATRQQFGRWSARTWTIGVEL
jgi:hypothetical protein